MLENILSLFMGKRFCDLDSDELKLGEWLVAEGHLALNGEYFRPKKEELKKEEPKKEEPKKLDFKALENEPLGIVDALEFENNHTKGIVKELIEKINEEIQKYVVNEVTRFIIFKKTNRFVLNYVKVLFEQKGWILTWVGLEDIYQIKLRSAFKLS